MTQNIDFPACAYYLGEPTATGLLKQSLADFIVTEELGFTPTGEGEHIFLWVEKQQQNTAFVAEQIAKHTGLPLRDVTYAGRKDKFALTRQWFGLYAPKGVKQDIDSLSLPGVTVLEQTRHNKKLRVGALQSNRFELTLRDVSNVEAACERLEQIKQYGVPNYFGDQRFGVRRNDDGSVSVGGTLALALRMVGGEPIRNRNKRNLAISSLRSALFNQLINQRIQDGLFDHIQVGDACKLHGSNSFFIESGPTLAESQHRYTQGDLSPSAPLLGQKASPALGDMNEWEQKTLAPYAEIVSFLQQEGVKTLPREIKIRPAALEWQVAHDKLTVSFTLPPGCFATSVLRECLICNETQESGNE